MHIIKEDIAQLCYFIHVSRDIIMLVLKQGETLICKDTWIFDRQ